MTDFSGNLCFLNFKITNLTARLDSGELSPLHAVVCNAGVQAGTAMTTTADGFESTFGVNHLAPFLMTNLLKPQLEASGKARVRTSKRRMPAAHRRARVSGLARCFSARLHWACWGRSPKAFPITSRP